ncbi:glycoside hydrolase [Teratosphaeria nubilosa]|uniref:Probable glucan endo-1,3-beta-glucosidase eglC n=1 Tax=Teratosphaeria nubilosa TaxID=161662 RepID=A0A6G1KWN7_9PEZI|nr:glycoside hydrolase [Teratosphaeria nubilosa]
MHLSTFVAAAAALATTEAAYTGFNYGSTLTDGSAKQQSDFQAEFSRAKTLQGTNGEFTSARLYTMIQGGTTDTPISAIPAAIDTQTSLLLGLWASAGQADFTNEVTALKSAISQYGSSFTGLITGISVGSEDLYRISPTGIENDSGVGAGPDVLVDYINQVKTAIANTAASGAKVGHVDTWTAWVNGSNDAVISAVDFLGVDAYPYFQNTEANSIDNGKSLFFEAYDNTVGAANGKPVWVTETGWPISGPTENEAAAGTSEAETYWQAVACDLLSQGINTYWYVLQDADPTTPSPSFGIVGSDLDSAPAYNLACSSNATTSSSASSSAPSSAVSTAESATAPASAVGSGTATVGATTPGPESAPSSATTGAATDAASAASGAVTSDAVSGPKTHTIYSTSFQTITSCAGNVCSSSVCSSSQYASSSATATSSKATSPAAASSSATTAAAPSGSSCPANLNGAYQYPHLIVPVDSSKPTEALGTQYNGTITPTVSTIFNFDIPSSYSGKTCSLVFLFPEQSQLETSAYTFNNEGGITVNELSSAATQSTTYNTVPSASKSDIGSVSSLQSGNSYVVATYSCPAGTTQSFEFISSGGLDLEFFEDFNPSPLGAYVTVC